MHIAPFVFLGGLLAALPVGLGAIGAHALKTQLAPEQLETYHTAVHYQMIHAIGLVLVGLLSLYQRSRPFDFAGWAMLVGIILFSGSLFAWLRPDGSSSFTRCRSMVSLSSSAGWCWRSVRWDSGGRTRTSKGVPQKTEGDEDHGFPQSVQ